MDGFIRTAVSPSMTAVPLVGLRMPANTRNSVVLPAPLWPLSPSRVPALRSSDTPSRAATSKRPELPASSRPPVVNRSAACLRERFAGADQTGIRTVTSLRWMDGDDMGSNMIV